MPARDFWIRRTLPGGKDQYGRRPPSTLAWRALDHWCTPWWSDARTRNASAKPSLTREGRHRLRIFHRVKIPHKEEAGHGTETEMRSDGTMLDGRPEVWVDTTGSGPTACAGSREEHSRFHNTAPAREFVDVHSPEGKAAHDGRALGKVHRPGDHVCNRWEGKRRQLAAHTPRKIRGAQLNGLPRLPRLYSSRPPGAQQHQPAVAGVPQRPGRAAGVIPEQHLAAQRTPPWNRLNETHLRRGGCRATVIVHLPYCL